MASGHSALNLANDIDKLYNLGSITYTDQPCVPLHVTSIPFQLGNKCSLACTSDDYMYFVSHWAHMHILADHVTLSMGYHMYITI